VGYRLKELKNHCFNT